MKACKEDHPSVEIVAKPFQSAVAVLTPALQRPTGHAEHVCIGGKVDKLQTELDRKAGMSVRSKCEHDYCSSIACRGRQEALSRTREGSPEGLEDCLTPYPR